MATGFVLNAQLVIRGPANVKAVVSNLQRQLQGVNATVNVQVPQGVANQINSLNTSLQNLNNSLTTIANNSSATNNLNKSLAATAKNAKAAQSASYELGEAIGQAGRKFATFSLAAGAMVSLIASLREGVGEALKFQNEMVRLRQVAGGSANGIAEIASEISRVSTLFGASSNELAEVSVTLRQAGLSADDTRIALETLAQASLAPTFTDMENSVEGAVAVMQQFNVTASELQGVFGAINRVSADFAVESDDIVHAIRRSGGAFKAAGGNLNELMALFTSVRQTTRESAETIASGFNTIFARIQRPQTVEQLRLMGINLRLTADEARAFGKTEGEFVGPFEAIRRLNEALASVPPASAEYAAIVEQIGGFRQVSKVVPLLQQFSVAQTAMASATFGASSLVRDSLVAQQSFAVQIGQLKEQFLDLFRVISSNDTLQAYARHFLDLATGALKLAKVLEPLIPLISAMAVVKTFQFAGSAFTGDFARGLKRGATSNRLATGGVVPGTGNSDTVSAMLTPGEFVIRKSAARSIGYDNLHNMNRYATGGIVRPQKFAVGGDVAVIKAPKKAFAMLVSDTEAPSNRIAPTIPIGSLASTARKRFEIDKAKMVASGKISQEQSDAIQAVSAPIKIRGLNQTYGKETRSVIERSVIDTLENIGKIFDEPSANLTLTAEDAQSVLNTSFGNVGVGRIFDAFLQVVGRKTQSKGLAQTSNETFDFRPVDKQGFSSLFGDDVAGLYGDAKYTDTPLNRGSVVSKGLREFGIETSSIQNRNLNAPSEKIDPKTGKTAIDKKTGLPLSRLEFERRRTLESRKFAQGGLVEIQKFANAGIVKPKKVKGFPVPENPKLRTRHSQGNVARVSPPGGSVAMVVTSSKATGRPSNQILPVASLKGGSKKRFDHDMGVLIKSGQLSEEAAANIKAVSTPIKIRGIDTGKGIKAEKVIRDQMFSTLDRLSNFFNEASAGIVLDQNDIDEVLRISLGEGGLGRVFDGFLNAIGRKTGSSGLPDTVRDTLDFRPIDEKGFSGLLSQDVLGLYGDAKYTDTVANRASLVSKTLRYFGLLSGYSSTERFNSLDKPKVDPDTNKEIIDKETGQPMTNLEYTRRRALKGKKFATGGKVAATPIKHFATGGMSTGTDTVPALLTPGEFVINRSAAQTIGYNNLRAMNRYAVGGEVLKKDEQAFLLHAGRGQYLSRSIAERVLKTGDTKGLAPDLATLINKAQLPRNVKTADRFREKESKIKPGGLQLPIPGDRPLAIIGQGTLGQAGTDLFTRTRSQIKKSLSSSVDEKLEAQKLNRFYATITSHAVSRQVTGQFHNNIGQGVFSAIDQVFASRFGGKLGKINLEPGERKNIEGILFEHFVQKVAGPQIMNKADQAIFDFVGGVPTNNPLNDVVIPSPINPTARTDVKNSIGEASAISSVFGKYLNTQIGFIQNYKNTDPNRPAMNKQDLRQGDLKYRVDLEMLGRFQKEIKKAEAQQAQFKALIPKDPRAQRAYEAALDRGIILKRKYNDLEQFLKSSNTNIFNDIEGRTPFATGGKVAATPRKRFASGGVSTGTDTVPALLTPGEFVVNRESAQRIGYNNLRSMNRYARGGKVFQYDAMDHKGNEVRKQKITATTSEEAQQLVRQRGFFITDIKEIKAVTSNKSGSARAAGAATAKKITFPREIQEQFSSLKGKSFSPDEETELVINKKKQTAKQVLDMLKSVDDTFNVLEKESDALETRHKDAVAKKITNRRGHEQEVLTLRAGQELPSAASLGRRVEEGGSRARVRLTGKREKKVEPKDEALKEPEKKTSFRDRLSQQGGFAAILAAQYAPMAINAIAGPNSRGGAAVGGALSSGAIGAQFGSIGGAPGVAIGAAAGAIFGFVTSLKDAEKEIRAVKFGKTMQTFTTTIERATADIKGANAGDFSSIRSGLQDILREADTQGGNRQQFFAEQVQAGPLQQFLAEIAKTANVNPQGTQTERFGAILAAQDGLGKDIVRVLRELPEFQNSSLREVLAPFEKIAVQQKVEEKQALDLEALQRETNNQVRSFSQLTTSLERATIVAEQFGASLDVSSGLFDNNLKTPKVSQFSRTAGSFGTQAIKQEDLSRTVDFITSPLEGFGGDLAKNFGQSAKGINAVLSNFPEILGNVMRRGIDDENTAVHLEQAILDVVPDSKEFGGVINQLKDAVNTFKPDDLLKRISTDLPGVIEELEKRAFPNLSQTIQDGAKKLEDNLNGFAQNLDRFNDMSARLGDAQDKFVGLQVESAASRRAITARRSGFVSRTDLSVQERNIPIQLRQERLTRLSGASANRPDIIGNELEGLTGRIRSLNDALASMSDSSEIKENREELAGLTLRANQLQTALENLTNVSERTAASQDRLSKINEEATQRLNLAERFFTADPGERLKINRTAQVAAGVSRGRIDPNRLSQDFRQALISMSQDLDNIITPIFNGLTGREFRESLLRGNPLTAGIANLPGGREAERQGLEVNIQEAFNVAAKAQAELMGFMQSQQGKFFDDLQANQDRFLTEFQRAIITSNIADLTSNVVPQEAKLVTARERENAGRRLADVGVKDFSAAQRVVADPKFEELRKSIDRQTELTKSIGKIDQIAPTIDNSTLQSFAKKLESTGTEIIDPAKLERFLSTQVNTQENLPDFLPAELDKLVKNISNRIIPFNQSVRPENFDLSRANEIINQEIESALTIRRDVEQYNISRLSGGISTSAVPAQATIELARQEDLRGDLKNVEGARTVVDLENQTKGIVDSLDGLKKPLNDLRNTLQSFNQGNPPAQTLALGGPVFKARGTDTVPAMLTPGEFVVNARATAANKDILEKINKSDKPLYRRGGGLTPARDRPRPLAGNIELLKKQLEEIQNKQGNIRGNLKEYKGLGSEIQATHNRYQENIAQNIGFGSQQSLFMSGARDRNEEYSRRIREVQRVGTSKELTELRNVNYEKQNKISNFTLDTKSGGQNRDISKDRVDRVRGLYPNIFDISNVPSAPSPTEEFLASQRLPKGPRDFEAIKLATTGQRPKDETRSQELINSILSGNNENYNRAQGVRPVTIPKTSPVDQRKRIMRGVDTSNPFELATANVDLRNSGLKTNSTTPQSGRRTTALDQMRQQFRNRAEGTNLNFSRLRPLTARINNAPRNIEKRIQQNPPIDFPAKRRPGGDSGRLTEIRLPDEVRTLAENLSRGDDPDKFKKLKEAILRSRPQHFALGGMAKGTDTVPAMLTPGEFIVNAPAARANSSLLNRINKSAKPIYRATGGPVPGGVRSAEGTNVNSLELSQASITSMETFTSSVDRLVEPLQGFAESANSLNRLGTTLQSLMGPLNVFSQNLQLLKTPFEGFNVAATNLGAGFALFNKTADALASAMTALAGLPRTITVQGTSQVNVAVTGLEASKFITQQLVDQIKQEIIRELKPQIINDLKSGSVV